MYTPQNDGNGSFKDHQDQVFRTADNGLPLAGTKVTIFDSNGKASPATWNGSVAVPDSK